MLSFECQSARAVLRDLESGVVEVTYYGVLNREAMSNLKREIHEAAKDAPALVVRMDRALIIASDIAPPPEWDSKKKIATAALVVRPEHFEMWTDYGHRVALLGVMRAVFLVSQASLAYRWAEAHALATLSISPRSRHCKQPFV